MMQSKSWLFLLSKHIASMFFAYRYNCSFWIPIFDFITKYNKDGSLGTLTVNNLMAFKDELTMIAGIFMVLVGLLLTFVLQIFVFRY